ncbi:MAG: ATP-binding protein [Acidobacteriota bacterium]
MSNAAPSSLEVPTRPPLDASAPEEAPRCTLAVDRPARGEIAAHDLAELTLFADLTEDQLEWLLDQLRVQDVPAGELYVEQGEPATELFVILHGRSHWRVDVGGQRLLFRVAERGSVGGLLPYSRMTHYGGEALAVEPCRLLRLRSEHFDELVARCPTLSQRLVSEMTNRVREATRVQQQREKMLALGKLAAGLAHELNNPAAAIRSETAVLTRRLAELPNRAGRLLEAGVTAATLRQLIADRPPKPTADLDADALTRSDREDAVAAWLEGCGVDEPWLPAETLVSHGFDADHLEELAGRCGPDVCRDLMLFVETTLATEALAADIAEASERISDLIASVKQYAHMDRGSDRQPTDLHAGIDATLIMFEHQIQRLDVAIEHRRDPELPLLEAHPAELNQVWTHLVSNALDAVAEAHPNGGGRVEISSVQHGPLVEVCIVDDGPGIPAELHERIFEPFFTTKDPGSGTGLGLDIVRRILGQHQGRLDIRSRPGRTEVCVTLPLDVEASQVGGEAPIRVVEDADA